MLGGLASVLVSASAPAQPAQPKVVVAWAGGLMEVRVGFDRAVDPEVAKLVVGQGITFGDGEKPGVVGRVGGDRGTLRVAAARLADEGRTLILVTDPHPREATYRLNLPVLNLPVEYNLGGVEVTTVTDGKKITTWWPTLDAADARKITKGSAEQDRLSGQTLKSEALTLQTLVSSSRGDVSLILDASHPFEVTFGTESAKSENSKAESHRAALKAEGTGEPIFVSVDFAGVQAIPTDVRAWINGKSLFPRSYVLSWAPPNLPAASASTIPPQLLTGGDPARGEVVFYGEQSKCATCHQIRGKGGVIGPDLTNLAGRDRSWVYQNIMEPSASIHPDYVSYTVTTKDGRIAMGVVRAEGADAVKVSGNDAKQTVIPRVEIEEIRPSSSSIMPVGLLGVIGDDNTRDLLAYLTAVRK